MRIREREPQDPLPLPFPLVATSMVRDDISQKCKPAVNGVFFVLVTTSSPPEAAQSHYWGWVVFGVAVALVLLSIVMLILGVM